MDFFTFIIIGIIIYSIFSKKDKPPKRYERRPERERPIRPQTLESQGDRQRNIFKRLDRQLKESAEEFEKELRRGRLETRGMRENKTVLHREAGQQPKKSILGDVQGTKDAWGDEGRSDYGKYVSPEGTAGTEGTTGMEGTVGTEGSPGQEGTWGTEGIDYATKETAEKTAIELSEIGKRAVYLPKEKMEGVSGFSSKEIVQGVIWSEILKEPKGRKLFYPSRRIS